MAFSCLVVASIAFLRADLAFRNGTGVVPTNLTYLFWFIEPSTAVSRDAVAGPATWYGLTEYKITLLLVGLSLLSSLAAVVACGFAWQRDDSSQFHAGVAVLALALIGLNGRLLAWLDPLHAVL